MVSLLSCLCPFSSSSPPSAGSTVLQITEGCRLLVWQPYCYLWKILFLFQLELTCSIIFVSGVWHNDQTVMYFTKWSPWYFQDPPGPMHSYCNVTAVFPVLHLTPPYFISTHLPLVLHIFHPALKPHSHLATISFFSVIYESVSVLFDFAFLFAHKSEVIWYLSFSVRLISLCIIPSRSIHVVAKGKILLFFMSE